MRWAVLLCLLVLLAPAGAAAQLPTPCVQPLCDPSAEPPADPPPDDQPPTPGPETPPPPSPEPGVLEGSQTFMVDPAHTGHLPDDLLVPPLQVRWKRAFRGNVDSPLYGEGRIYVTADGAVRALDPRTGADLWAVPTAEFVAAYDAGRVFVASREGHLRALSARDGSQLWALRLHEDYAADSLVVATEGMVYAAAPGSGGGSGIWGIDAASGEVRWKTSGGGPAAMPAVYGSFVIAGYTCGSARAWWRHDGSQGWNRDAGCSGGSGATPTAHGARLYLPNDRVVLDTGTGEPAAAPPDWAGGNPLFAGNVGVIAVGGGDRYRAFHLADGRALWTVRVDDGGDPTGPASQPIIVGSTLYTLSGGRLSAHSMEDGAQLWRDKVPESDGGSPDDRGAVSAGRGVLLVPGGGTLTAYESIFQPQPDGLAAGVGPTDVLIGRRSGVFGVAGTRLRSARPRVTVEVDRAPFGRRWRRDGTLAMRPDGGFTGIGRPQRNTRVRVRVGGAVARAGTVYVYPRVKFRIRGVSQTHFSIRVRMRGPRGVRLGGRRAVIYLGRRSVKRLYRIASARLRRTGRGRAVASVTRRRLSRVGRRDFVVMCIPRQHRLGMGRADLLARRCGASRIRFR